MRNIIKAGGFITLILAVLSCSLAGKLAEKGLDKGLNTQRVGSLWSDVPPMDGLNDSPTDDLPLTVKLVLHTFVNMVLNSDKTSKNVSTDWIFYKYKGSQSDIKSFYTPERMKSSGNWELADGMKSPCIDGSEKGLPGNVCLFQKTEDGKQKGLIILALPVQDKDVPYFVYFFRAEMDTDPASNK